MKLRRYTFRILCRSGGVDAFETVDGFAMGDSPKFATHRADGYGGKRWNITDLATGMSVSVGDTFWRKAQAEAWLLAKSEELA